MDGLELREDGSAVTLRVRVTPRAARERLSGVHAGALKVSLTAAPVDGSANAALIRLLARLLGLPQGAIRILHGERGRLKTLRVEGVDAATLRTALLAAVP